MGRSLFAAVRDGAASKEYLRGAHRSAPPDETLDRVRPLFSAMGITRLGEITRLDRIGVPVAQAVRPMGRSLTVSQGKGLDRTAALASAAMEAAETWHAEVAAPDLPLATRDEICRSGRVIALEGLAARPAEPGALDAVPVRWCMATLLGDGGEIAVPFDCVGLDFTAPADCELFQRSTNGLASGLSAAEAASAALCEVIERDCVADFLALDPRARDARRLSLSALEGSVVGSVVARLTAAGMRLDVWDVTNDIGVAAYLARIAELPRPDLPAPLGPSGGSGCHLDAEVAVARAVTEAAQSRAARIAGVRDDIPVSHYVPVADRNHATVIEGVFVSGAVASLRADESTGTFAEDVAMLEKGLARAGLDEVALLDLGKPDTGIAVIRALVPGLAVCLPGNVHMRGLRHGQRDGAAWQ